MENEVIRTFLVDVKITKATSGALEGDTNYEEILKKIKTGISEAVAICAGVINSYQVGEILEMKEEEQKKEAEKMEEEKRKREDYNG